MHAVASVKAIFQSANSATQLGWPVNGDDPCGQSWKGITCSDNRVTQMYVIVIILLCFAFSSITHMFVCYSSSVIYPILLLLEHCLMDYRASHLSPFCKIIFIHSLIHQNLYIIFNFFPFNLQRHE